MLVSLYGCEVLLEIVSFFVRCYFLVEIEIIYFIISCEGFFCYVVLVNSQFIIVNSFREVDVDFFKEKKGSDFVCVYIVEKG